MTRLLIVTTAHVTLEGFLLPYAAHFRAKGWLVDGLARGATRSAPCQAAFDRCFDAEWSRSPLDPHGLFGMSGFLRKLVRDGNYDLLHVHTPVAAFITRCALRHLPRSGPRIVYTAHGFHFHAGRSWIPNALFASAERLAGRWTDRLVVINQADRQEALRRGIVDASRLRFMPGIGLDLTHYSPASVPAADVEAVRRAMGLSAAQALFLMVGEFNPGKRHRDLLMAFAGLEDDSAHLAFAGTGLLEEELRGWVAKAGLSQRVHFLGFQKDVRPYMLASLATILPSEREGLSRSVMESIALGVPVIGSSARGVRDLLEECGGFQVPVGDSPALGRAMLRLIREPHLAQRVGALGRSKVERYGLPNLVHIHEQLYDELLAERRSGSSRRSSLPHSAKLG